ncbi:SHQ1-like protein (macronuclear) [Tetrahymena thermophila SB210]|uniref:SHQ1-like protein n=1 Tax=Tetrahymena thermophila (strain SB210) TaxID=312017 RepID=I7MN11_TETTS|nr:SHQ1-like protein [Tetrahymena thermophila SB210]EAS07700.1 SHQ1-like protein [Tetrahymena thermophila SB210]|eukprot:XP_001027942.1 SHQ1-like protein [Tetrahymena thermophila SB210]
MIIPQFKLTQDSKYVVAVIRIPYVKISNAEFYIEGRNFKFFLHPYLLSIEFKNDLFKSDEPAAASYNHDTYELTVKIQKATEGEHFEDLDMITQLLAASRKKEVKKPEQKKNKKPLIEVIGEADHTEQTNNDEIEEIKQQVENLVLSQDAYAYGFNQQTKGYFQDLGEEIFEIGHFNPDEIPISDRINLRNEYVNSKFDEDAYIYDTFENEEIDSYIKLNLEFLSKVASINQDTSSSYTPEEWNQLKKLPNKEFIINNKNKCLMEIIDILFAFAYELRCMGGEFSCESAATINYLSSVLSCFICDNTLNEIIRQCYRRALTFPMLRNFKLIQQAQQDLVIILQSGRAGVLKTLLQIKYLFEVNEPRYHLNNLYIEDFCIWVQTLKDEDFQNLAGQIQQIEINKKDLDLNLVEIDQDCEQMLLEQQESDKHD